jgi:hypothetical protein
LPSFGVIGNGAASPHPSLGSPECLVAGTNDLHPPRLPTDLPAEPTSRLIAGGHVNGCTIQGDSSNNHLEGLVLEDPPVVGCSFIATDLRGVRMVDVLVEGSDLSGADLEEAELTR